MVMVIDKDIHHKYKANLLRELMEEKVRQAVGFLSTLSSASSVFHWECNDNVFTIYFQKAEIWDSDKHGGKNIKLKAMGFLIDPNNKIAECLSEKFKSTLKEKLKIEEKNRKNRKHRKLQNKPYKISDAVLRDKVDLAVYKLKEQAKLPFCWYYRHRFFKIQVFDGMTLWVGRVNDYKGSCEDIQQAVLAALIEHSYEVLSNIQEKQKDLIGYI